ncbi:MAG: ABC transporter ATP-binding protein [Acidobacteriaceae bacterium]
MFDIKLDRVSKTYFAPADPPSRRSYLPRLRLLGKTVREIRAVDDVSFEVETGECFGIIGHNGSGKSSLLKLLSSITAPTSGEITIRGRLSALIEVSSGFHPELSGRENIFLNGSMLGMSRSEIARKVGDIAEFAGLEEYLDIPVKRYSSGMYVRLGFSIAAHLEPDILLLDEVLAVGDIAFQAKCLKRIDELRQIGRTIVLISHDLEAIHRLCDRALLMHQGRVVMSGSPAEVIDHYQKVTFADEPVNILGEGKTAKPAECSVISFHATDIDSPVRTGYPMITRFGFQTTERLNKVSVSVFIYWPSGYLCTQITTASSGRELTLEPAAHVIEFCCPVLELQPGIYRIDLLIESNGRELDRKRRCAILRVQPGKAAFGDFFVDTTWNITSGERDSIVGAHVS